jgi:phospholipase C
MPHILAPIKHVVVVMLENRSLDNMLGTLYTDGPAPSVVLPRAVHRDSMVCSRD